MLGERLRLTAVGGAVIRDRRRQGDSVDHRVGVDQPGADRVGAEVPTGRAVAARPAPDLGRGQRRVRLQGQGGDRGGVRRRRRGAAEAEDPGRISLGTKKVVRPQSVAATSGFGDRLRRSRRRRRLPATGPKRWVDGPREE